jgi:hypothetical protein
VKNEDEEWELLQFQTATLVDTSTYDLTGLLRGQFGTEGAMRNPVAAGATFLLLDSAIAAVGMTLDDVGLPYNWRYGPSSEAIDDISFTTALHAFTGRGLRPFSPCQIRGTRDATSGDWLFTWIRRTRLGGDSWETEEVPLAETTELYDLEILDGPEGVVLRTVPALGSPSYAYSAAQQTADFGSAQVNVNLRVYQRSSAYGRGAGAEALVWN